MNMEQLTNSQFLSEIITLTILGIVYVAILVYCARRDPSGLPQKHKTLRTVLGVLSLLISAFVLVLMMVSLQSGKVNVNPLTELGYNLSRYGTSNPSEIMKETGLEDNTIFRGSDVPIVWGYPSIFQYVIRSLVLYFFILLGLGLYLLLFKPSNTTKGRKVCKVFGFVLLWMTYSGIPSLHYFDVYEILPIVFIAVLSFLCLFVWGRKKQNETNVTDLDEENVPSANLIQHENEQSNNNPKKPKISLITIGFFISFPLLVVTIFCYSINLRDNKKVWHYNTVWKETENDVEGNWGLPCVRVYEYHKYNSYGYRYDNIGYQYYYSIPNGYDLNELRIQFSEHNDNKELIPFLDAHNNTDYCVIQKHPVLKDKEAYYCKSYKNQDNNYWVSYTIIIEDHIRVLIAFGTDSEQCDENISYLLSDYDYPSMRISDEISYFLTGLCLLFWIVFAIVYYSRRMKELRLSNGLMNKPAIRLSRHVLWCTILWYIIGGIAMFYDDGDDVDNLVIILIGIVVFVMNIFILKYTMNRINQEPSEDYLIPKWFKLQNANVLKNMGIVRLFLLFLIWPIFVLIPVPFVGAFAIMYSAGVLIVFYLVKIGIYAIKWIITWIISGTKTKVSYKE